jgi:hypothetical protein
MIKKTKDELGLCEIRKRTFLASMIMKKTPYTSHSLMGLSNCWKSNRSSEFFFNFSRRKMNTEMENSDSKRKRKRDGERAKDYGS